MKKFMRVLLIILIVGLFGCSNNSVEDNDVLELLKTYKTVQYTIEEPLNPPTSDQIAKELKAYLSEEAFDEQIANRAFSIAPDVAAKTKKSIKVNNIQIEKVKENDNGTIDYNYTLEIQLGEGSNAEVIKNKGQLTVSSEGNLKIFRDWEEKDDLISISS